MSIALPLRKRLDYLAVTKGLLGKRAASKKVLLSLSGKLMHATRILPQGRPFIRSLYDRAHSVEKNHFMVNLPIPVRDDIRWWADVLSCWLGTSLLCFGPWHGLTDLRFSADASTSFGFGIVFGHRWCSVPWPSVEARAFNIATLELIPMVAAAHLWGHLWSRKRVFFLSDNMATVASVNSWLPKDRHLTALLKRLAKLAIQPGHKISKKMGNVFPLPVFGVLGIMGNETLPIFPLPILQLSVTFVTHFRYPFPVPIFWKSSVNQSVTHFR